MSKQTHLFRALTLTPLLAVMAVVLLNQGTLRLTAASDCVGKPYGYPGCPTRSTPASASSVATTGYCGNAIIEDQEECDKGRFNGKTNCSLECKNLFCGDGVVSRDISEECEPETEEVYVEDSRGNLTTETRFVGRTDCGWYCQPPSCTEAGSCAGGCRLKYIGECASSA